MIVLYQDAPLFLHGFQHKLGSVKRNLEEMKTEKLLAGTVEALSAMGYRDCLGLGDDESLVALATAPLSRVLELLPDPRCLVFQHCNVESAALAREADDTIGASRNRYFPAALMKEVQLDHLPYFCSFASGCAGFLSVLLAAAGLNSRSDKNATICVMADNTPVGDPFDMVRERILGSDHSSAFVLGYEERGYQLLGISYYSTTRTLVPLVEIVKRSVQMTGDLAASLQLDLAKCDVVIHYPNIFPDTWKMVTRYLRLPTVEHVLNGMPERAHCGASDSVISLAKLHRGQEGRLHVVINYGVGLHLGVCVLKEKETAELRT